MDINVKLLEHGAYEELKLAVHATTLGLAAVMCLYNAAAWLRRGERHHGINAVVYAALIAWERKHSAHHWAACVPVDKTPSRPIPVPARPDDMAA